MADDAGFRKVKYFSYSRSVVLWDLNWFLENYWSNRSQRTDLTKTWGPKKGRIRIWKLESHQVCKTQSKGRWQWLAKKPVISFLLFFEGDIRFRCVLSVKMSLSWCPQNCEVSTPCKRFPFGPPSFYQDCALAGQEESNPSIDMKRRQPCLPLCFNDFHIQYDKFSWDRPATQVHVSPC